MARASALARLARSCLIVLAALAVGVPGADARPRAQRSSSTSRKATKQPSKSKRGKPTKAEPAPAPPARTGEPNRGAADAPPADDLATRIDALDETPVDAIDDADEDLATKIDALAGPVPDELARLRVRDPEAVGEAFPGIRHWIHPVVRAEVLTAKFPGGEFGAPRRGVPRSRGCGGHCGVDLHAERGRPIVAVAAGVLVRVDHQGSGLSGRHVRIRHADGTFTTYMHLDRVLDGLDVGKRVSAGEQLGVLGSTGVSSGVAHLHFELEIPSKQDNTNGDHRRGFTRWIDAAPFLRQARVIERALRRRARPPGS